MRTAIELLRESIDNKRHRIRMCQDRIVFLATQRRMEEQEIANVKVAIKSLEKALDRLDNGDRAQVGQDPS